MRTLFTILTAAVCLFGAVGLGQADEKLRVAVVLTGPINDGGWNESAFKGLTRAQKELGLEVAYSENVLLPDSETVMADYANKGYNLIIGSGFEFTEPAKSVAADFPKIHFAVINGRGFQEPNLSTWGFRTEQPGFLSGALAALLTKSGKVGYIGGMNTPHIQVAGENFIMGAKYINPDCEALLTYVGSWSDVAKAKEMAFSMLDRGADVLVGNANAGVLGVIEAAKNRNKSVVGYIDDQHAIAPDNIPVSVMQSVENLTLYIIKQGVAGKLEPKYNRIGIAEDVVGVSPFYGDAYSAEDQAKIQEIITGLADGSIEKKGALWEQKQ